MKRTDRMMLWGAWSTMAVVGLLSFRAISRQPREEAWVRKTEDALNRIYNNGIINPPPRAENPKPPAGPSAGYTPALPHPWAGFIQTRALGTPIAPRRTVCLILPVALTAAQAELSGVTLTWALADAEADFGPWMIPTASKPDGFIVYRRTGDGDEAPLATLKADARSFTDASVEFRKTYHYRVAVTGKETELATGASVPSIREIGSWADVKIPSGTKIKLVGGDQGTAFMRIDTWDRSQKKYVSRIAVMPTGQPIGGSGWTLRSLRFDKFTLVADVTDDDGVDRVLTTKD